MIDARMVATRGLAPPVTARMVAVRGLWPVEQTVEQPSLGWGSFPGHGTEYEPWRDVRPKKPAKPTDIALPPLLPREIEAVRRSITEDDDEETLLMLFLADEH